MPLISDLGNYRPLVPKGDRTIWSTTENTKPCGQVREANFSCASTICQTTSGEPCIFPFIYKGETMMSCTTRDNSGVPWCSVEVDAAGQYIQGRWAQCTHDGCDWQTTSYPSPSPAVIVVGSSQSGGATTSGAHTQRGPSATAMALLCLALLQLLRGQAGPAFP
mmetsp:Transcript_144749/g.252347  ORF Transcript_144749/g.252347 Transcript_144749/m.252347 type:complete len:164 (-) Transcript_144749:96-587(-)